MCGRKPNWASVASPSFLVRVGWDFEDDAKTTLPLWIYVRTE